jgi:acetyl esterase/lipase
MNEIQTVITEDIEFLRHGDKPLRLRLIKPAGSGPYPIVLDVHGGAWCGGNIESCCARNTYLANAGIAAAAVEFRQGPDKYPSSLQDINYAIRWIKAHAGDLRLDAANVGLSGNSSGGHLAMLSAMRPGDPRYTAIALDTPVDAQVKCIGVTAPVINPLSRYRNALKNRDAPNPPEWSLRLPASHDIYWVTEENMSEASPLLMLERGEKVVMPPALYIQRTPDEVHDYRDPRPDRDIDVNEPERFVQNYRKAGGDIEFIYVEAPGKTPDVKLFEPLAQFFKAQFA